MNFESILSKIVTYAMAPLGKVLWTLISALISEKFFKSVIIKLLEAGAKKTEWELDDAFVKDIKEAWGVAP